MINRIRRLVTSCGIFLFLMFCHTQNVYAVFEEEPGVYPIEASLSCYVNAMGGVEFGDPLLTDTYLIVYEDKTASITMEFTKSSVTIYGVTCDTFIDPAPSYQTMDRGVLSGTIGVYMDDGTLNSADCLYTLSDDTAPNPDDVEVHYVNAINFPVESKKDTYQLALYINSNVMGVEFCNENDLATAATYPATLTVYWDGNRDVTGAEEPVPGSDVADLLGQPVTDGDAIILPGLHLRGFSTGSQDSESAPDEAEKTQTEPDAIKTTTAEDDIVAAAMNKEISDEPSPAAATYTQRQINPVVMFCLICIAAFCCLNGFVILYFRNKHKRGEEEA